MSEIEKQEFSQRMAALTNEEQIIAAKYIPDGIMFAELAKRQRKRDTIINAVAQIMEGRNLI